MALVLNKLTIELQKGMSSIKELIPHLSGFKVSGMMELNSE
jgi:hypothetical protein